MGRLSWNTVSSNVITRVTRDGKEERRGYIASFENRLRGPRTKEQMQPLDVGKDKGVELSPADVFNDFSLLRLVLSSIIRSYICAILSHCL